jgi:branched-chain amino acid transport system substrate-binding protein
VPPGPGGFVGVAVGFAWFAGRRPVPGMLVPKGKAADGKEVISTEESMRLFSAARGLTITAVFLAAALVWPAPGFAQQAATEGGAPDLKIELPGTSPKPAPAKPGKAVTRAGAAAKPDSGVTIITGSGDGTVEIIVPENAPAKHTPKSAAKTAPAHQPKPGAEPQAKPPTPVEGTDRSPLPYDATVPPAAKTPAQAQPAKAPAPAPAAAASTPADKTPLPFDAVPAPAAPAAQATPAKPPAPAAKTFVPPPPAPAVVVKGPKGKPVKLDPSRPMPARRLGEIALGALLPMTGKNQARGQAAAAALELAKQDVGDYFAKVNVAGSLTIQVEDTESSPKVALERLKSLLVRGIRVVIGPDFDDEIAEVRDFAKTNGMLLLSPGSAGPFLSKKEGELIRFAPMNTHQSEAAAGLASQEGVDALVPIWEGDLYGDELVVHLKAHFRNMGGTVLAGVRYRPGAANFAGHLADLKAQITQVQKQYKKIAIYYAGHAGIVEVLKEAEKLGLTAYRWYGCDATAMNPELTRDEAAAELSQAARLVSPRFGETETDAYAALEKRIQEKTREFPATECVVAYDIAWLAAMTGMICGGLDNFEAFRAALPVTAEHFHGVSGWMALNEDLDRREDWGYDFWMIKKDKGKYYWEKFARYQFQPGTTKQFYIHNAE